ncbi:uncharacterized protein LOC120629361 [Pararge aegeria]|uniref:Jg7407 protein n=2 Tax=Pararge aegeria TaxID=116150 RepID=A0A8S4RSE5_9NEOP|nr:uncharacterized protein LOC120629361 [Pararge aegeria]CAH2240064.1 jg7407 [Pararge aegeria aegeria]
MFKSIIAVCLCVVLIEARPKWQYLPAVPGYVPVYIRNGDTPLEEINPELAEAFHGFPAGRSVGKQVDAVPDTPELADQPQFDVIPEPSESNEKRPYGKKLLEKKKKASFDIVKPVERR